MMIRIKFGREHISLNRDGSWEASSSTVEPLAGMADVLSRPPHYEYSPSHGAYGPLLAHRVAGRLGGLAEVPAGGGGPPPDGVVF